MQCRCIAQPRRGFVFRNKHFRKVGDVVDSGRFVQPVGQALSKRILHHQIILPPREIHVLPELHDGDTHAKGRLVVIVQGLIYG